MDFMEGIVEIIGRLQLLKNTTSPSTVANKYKCSLCKDTTWLLDDDNRATRCKCFAIEKARSLWRNFGVNPNEAKKISEYKPFDNLTMQARDKAISYIMNFDSLEKGSSNSFGLFGQAGCGKTHIVVAIGAALLNREHNPKQVVYMPYIEAMRELKSNSMDDDAYNRIIWKYQKAAVLIIDDLFKDKVRSGKLIGELKDTDIKQIYPIINYRYINKLPMLVSSECTPTMLMDLDVAIAGRVLESCGDNITIFKDSKYNYRMKNFTRGDDCGEN
jgi:DNA replication protein DnaC